MDDLAHAAPRGQRRAAHDRQLRGGPERGRPEVPAGVDAAARRRGQRGRLRHPAQLPGPRRPELLRLLPARPVRLRTGGPPAGAGRVPAVQPGHVAGVGPQRRHPHPEEGRPGGGPAQPPARDPPGDLRRPGQAAAGRAAPAGDEQPPPDLPVGAPVRHLRPPAAAVQAPVQHLLHQPRGQRHAPLLGGPPPRRLRAARAGPGVDRDLPRRGPVGHRPGRGHDRAPGRPGGGQPRLPAVDRLQHGAAGDHGRDPGDPGVPHPPAPVPGGHGPARRGRVGAAAGDAAPLQPGRRGQVRGAVLRRPADGPGGRPAPPLQGVRPTASSPSSSARPTCTTGRTW